jgi:hypothetical protein
MPETENITSVHVNILIILYNTIKLAIEHVIKKKYIHISVEIINKIEK